MLKKKTKIRKRLARIVLAALLCSGGLHGLAAPSVAEAATTITVSNITGNTATGDITVTADPPGSMLGQYVSELGLFRVRPDAAIAGISEINITGSTIPAYCSGSNPDSADAGSRRVTVSGANTVLGAVYANYQEGAEANNNTLIIEKGASITGNEAPFVPAMVIPVSLPVITAFIFPPCSCVMPVAMPPASISKTPPELTSTVSALPPS